MNTSAPVSSIKDAKYLDTNDAEVRFLSGFVASVDIMHGLFTATLENGWRLGGIKPLTHTASALKSLLNMPDDTPVPCMVMVVGAGLRQEAFMLGVYSETDPEEKSPLKTDDFINGDQGFALPELGSHIVLRRGGQIDLKASDMCQVRLNPKSSKVQVIASNLEYYRDSENKLTWLSTNEANTECALSLQLVPNLLLKEKKTSLTVDKDGVQLNTDFDVSVNTTGNAKTTAEKVQLEGKVALGDAEASNAIALANETVEAIRAIADSLSGLMTDMQTTALSVAATGLDPWGAAMQGALTSGLLTLNQAILQFNSLKSTKHTIDE